MPAVNAGASNVEEAAPAETQTRSPYVSATPETTQPHRYSYAGEGVDEADFMLGNMLAQNNASVDEERAASQLEPRSLSAGESHGEAASTRNQNCPPALTEADTLSPDNGSRSSSPHVLDKPQWWKDGAKEIGSFYG